MVQSEGSQLKDSAACLLASRDEINHIYVTGILKAVQNHISITNNMHLLEIGCGGGLFTNYLNRMCTVTGIDISEESLKNNLVKNTCKMDVRNLGFPDKSFDISFCHAVLHHVEDLAESIGEMTRVTRQYLVIIEPNRFHLVNFLLALVNPEERQLLGFAIRDIMRFAEKFDFHQTALFPMGLIPPSITPRSLIPILPGTNFKQPFGWDQVLIMEKEKTPFNQS